MDKDTRKIDCSYFDGSNCQDEKEVTYGNIENRIFTCDQAELSISLLTRTVQRFNCQKKNKKVNLNALNSVKSR
jgi:hypothetical protein